MGSCSMAQRGLRQRSLRSSFHNEQRLRTPEPLSHDPSEALKGQDSSDKTPTQQPKAPGGRKRVIMRPGRPGKKRKRNDMYDDPEAILGGVNSPLFDESVNIKNIIMHPKALEILGDMASQYQALESDALSTAVAAFKEDGACGRFDPDWIIESTTASEFRFSGQTAEFEEDMFNETWCGDDEDMYYSPRDDRDTAEDDGCHTFKNSIKDFRDGEVSTDNVAGPSSAESPDEIALDIGLNDQKKLEDEVNTIHVSTAVHNADAPISQFSGSQTST